MRYVQFFGAYIMWLKPRYVSDVPRSLILEFIQYEFNRGHNASEATKNICWLNDEVTVDRMRVTRWFKKFRPSFKNLDDQAKSSMHKVVDFLAEKAIAVSSIWRVSGKINMLNGWSPSRS